VALGADEARVGGGLDPVRDLESQRVEVDDLANWLARARGEGQRRVRLLRQAEAALRAASAALERAGAAWLAGRWRRWSEGQVVLGALKEIGGQIAAELDRAEQAEIGPHRNRNEMRAAETRNAARRAGTIPWPPKPERGAK